MFRERVAELSTLREQTEIEADRIEAMVNRAGPTLALQDAIRIAQDARAKLRRPGAPPRQITRALLQRVEVVGKDEARVEGSCEELLKALASATGNRAIMTVSAGGLNSAWSGQDSSEGAYAFSVLI
jgi:hypothetical protein